MSIHVVCPCGSSLILPEKYAGQHVQCPTCNVMMRIPTKEEDQELTRWLCTCGQRLKARARTAGKTVHCPKCGTETVIPLVTKHESFIEKTCRPHDDAGVSFTIHDSASRTDDGPSPLAHSPTVPPEHKKDAPTEPLAVIPEKGTEEESDELLELEAIQDDELDFVESDTNIPIASAGGHSAEMPSAQMVPVKQPDSPKPAPISASETTPVVQIQGDSDEGIHAPSLVHHFNTKGGKDAAFAGAMHVLHGYWLYIPYALLASCMTIVVEWTRIQASGQLWPSLAWLFFPFLFSIFLWAAFLACIKDGIFQRFMGIERMLSYGVRHFLRFGGTALLMIPIGAAIGIPTYMGVIAALVILPGFFLKALLILPVIIVSIFVVILLQTPLAVVIIEETNPFTAIGRGIGFALKHLWSLFTMAAISFFIGCGAIGVVYLFWLLSKLLLFAMLPHWLFAGLENFVSTLIGAAVIGQLASSFMLLYLSHIGDERRLRQVQNKLRGPTVIPTLLYAVIAVLTIGLLGMCYFHYGK